MFDSPSERLHVYRHATTYDCWGSRRAVRTGTRGGIWYLDPRPLDTPAEPQIENGSDGDRLRLLAFFESSGAFTARELDTLYALVIERLTLDEIAARDQCSRQAVVARLTGNSRGQGGILKKARRLLADGAHHER